VGCVRKTKILLEDILKHRKLPFLHKSHRILFFREILCADIECPDVHPEFFFHIFWAFSNMFFGQWVHLHL
jgi:hypothetical protein